MSRCRVTPVSSDDVFQDPAEILQRGSLINMLRLKSRSELYAPFRMLCGGPRQGAVGLSTISQWCIPKLQGNKFNS